MIKPLINRAFVEPIWCVIEDTDARLRDLLRQHGRVTQPVHFVEFP
jgi:hypothetical protein